MAAQTRPVAHGHSPGQGIYTLFKRKSLFKPKYKIMTSQKCESRHLACHQEPFAPTFRNHTCSSPTVAIWWPFPPTFQGLSGSGNCGRGQGAVHEEMESPRDHGRGSKHEALANSGQSCLIPKPARWHGHSPGQGIYTLFKRKSLFKPKHKIMT